jgi:hypothetical protein
MARFITRRALILGLAAGLVATQFQVKDVAASPATAARAATTTTKHYTIIGASITRLSTPGLRANVPGITIDALDGRSWEIVPSHGGPTLWEAYQHDVQFLHAGDWLIMENGYGTVPVAAPGTQPMTVTAVRLDVATNTEYVDKLIASLPAGICLAWVLPHVYYGPQTPVQVQWNADLAALLQDRVPKVACHALIPWDRLVNDWARIRLSQGMVTAAMAGVGEPLVYDGRHPTFPTGTGTRFGPGAARFGRAVGQAVGTAA